MTIFSLRDVVARWGYSELVDAIQSKSYKGNGIDKIRLKRIDGVSFDSLSEPERDLLVCTCRSLRPVMWKFFNDLSTFELVELTRTSIGTILIPPNGWAKPEFIPFFRYMATNSDDCEDARNVKCDPATYQPPRDPLTMGRHNGRLVLVDGYHRAAAFWKISPESVVILAFVPSDPGIK